MVQQMYTMRSKGLALPKTHPAYGMPVSENEVFLVHFFCIKMIICSQCRLGTHTQGRLKTEPFCV